MQFTGHSLRVHHTEVGTLPCLCLVPYYHLRDFFRLLTIGMCHFRYLRNGRCDRHRAEITIMQFIGHSLRVHHFFLRHTENFYLVSYCEPSCILQKGYSTFPKAPTLLEPHHQIREIFKEWNQMNFSIEILSYVN